MLSPEENAVASPCVQLCKMSLDTDLCEGCLRTRDEITVWSRASNPLRLRILEAVALRRSQLTQPVKADNLVVN
ncbi:MAG: DUF1289 domain-containing protein [Pseudomonadota bacterium]